MILATPRSKFLASGYVQYPTATHRIRLAFPIERIAISNKHFLVEWLEPKTSRRSSFIIISECLRIGCIIGTPGATRSATE
jgi:hypothetical protein